jgi:hypothetical protein
LDLEDKKGVAEMKQSQKKSQSLDLTVRFPILVKKMTEQETKGYHLKRLKQLSERPLGEIAQLEEPTDEQKEWVLSRLSHPETWPEVHENKDRRFQELENKENLRID